MPIPFRDLEEDEPSGVAAFLRFVEEPGGNGLRGALFIMSPRGVPLEFTFTRIDVRSGVLWKVGQARNHALASLSRALFESTSHIPIAVFALADETPADVFSENLKLEVSLCRVATQEADPATPPEEVQQIADSLSLLWVNGPPVPGGETAKLVEILEGRRLLLEPFERAALGIQEAFDS